MAKQKTKPCPGCNGSGTTYTQGPYNLPVSARCENCNGTGSAPVTGGGNGPYDWERVAY